jgi:exopolyphosphatase/guanosine-5'-triphosphate,3'-diphosphate pyrophosphatase
MTLIREDRIAVSKLAAILRVADALERGHAQQVQDIRIERRPAELLILVHGVSDLTLERRALAEKADLFEDTFGMRVRLEEALSDESAPRTRPVE